MATKLPPLTKLSMLNVNKPIRMAQHLINTHLEKLKQLNSDVTNTSSEVTDDVISCKLIINGEVSYMKLKRRRLRKVLDVFEDCREEEEVDVEEVGDVDEVPCKKRKTVQMPSTLDEKCKGVHRSYRHKHNKLKDLLAISNCMPIL